MNAFCVSYDLHPLGKRYDALYEQLKQCSGWWHYLDSTWLVVTAETIEQLAARLRAAIDANDNLLIIRIRTPYDGWLPADAWEWINAHVPPA